MSTASDIERTPRVVRRIAVGGMAELFEAEQPQPNGPPRRVALKRLLPGAPPEARARLARERRIMEGLSSPDIVRCYGGTEDTLLLEYVDGVDLSALLDHTHRRGQRLSLGAALAVVASLARALESLHGARDGAGHPLGLVHRDVNPSNVLVSSAGVVKLADLGLVHVGLEGQSSVAGLKGTLAWMAPEQLIGGQVDARTDVYAAGLIAYELLTGVPARPAGMVGVAELLSARATLPTAPSRVRPDLPSALDAPILAALAPTAAMRPTAAAWRVALHAAAGTAPDPAALARLAAACVTPHAAVERTLRPATVPPSPAPQPAMRRRVATRTILAAAIMLTAGGVAGHLATNPPSDRARAQVAAPHAETAPEAVVSTAAAPPPRSAPRAPGVPSDPPPLAPWGRSTDDARDDAPVDHGAMVSVASLRPSEPAPSVDPAPLAAELASPIVHAPARRVGSATARPAATTAAEPGATGVALTIAPVGDGALYVTGGGGRGLAPRSTTALAEGATLLRVLGAGGRLEALLRLNRRGATVSVTVGAPPGRWFEVRCGDAPPHATPLRDLALDSTLTCDLTDTDGDHVAFSLTRHDR